MPDKKNGGTGGGGVADSAGSNGTSATKKLKRAASGDVHSDSRSESSGEGSHMDDSLSRNASSTAVEPTARLSLRKEKKSAREKARRQRENALFDELATMCNVPTDTRDKSSVLKAVIKRVEELRSKHPGAAMAGMPGGLAGLHGLLHTSSSSSFSSNGTDHHGVSHPMRQHQHPMHHLPSTLNTIGLDMSTASIPTPSSTFSAPTVTSAPNSATSDDIYRSSAWSMPAPPIFPSFPSLATQTFPIPAAANPFNFSAPLPPTFPPNLGMFSMSTAANMQKLSQQQQQQGLSQTLQATSSQQSTDLYVQQQHTSSPPHKQEL